MFAKLFEDEVLGQFLVVIKYDDAPYVEISCKPPGFGVCTQSFKFQDTEGGEQAAQAFFDKADLQKCKDESMKVFRTAYQLNDDPLTELEDEFEKDLERFLHLEFEKDPDAHD